MQSGSVRRTLLGLLLPALAACTSTNKAKLPPLPSPDVLAAAYYQYRNAGCVALIDACEDWMFVNETTDEIGIVDCERPSRNVADCRFAMNRRIGSGREMCRITLDWGPDLGGKLRWHIRRAQLRLPAYVPQIECREVKS
jgi:hypothetical protein